MLDASKHVGKFRRGESRVLASTAGASGGEHVATDCGHAGLVGGALCEDDDDEILGRHVRPCRSEAPIPPVATVVEDGHAISPASPVEEVEAGPDVGALTWLS